MDSIRLCMHSRMPPSFEMRQDGFTKKGAVFFKNVEVEYCTVTLLASNYFDQPCLSVRFSAPKLIYGTSVKLLNAGDIWNALDRINEIVQAETRIEFDAYCAKIMELDFCHNWKLNDEVEVFAYIQELKSRSIPYKHRTIHAKENGVDTVYWKNQSEEILFYPKHAETKSLLRRGRVSPEHLSQSVGMLRWEHRLRKSHKIDEFASQFGCETMAFSFLKHLDEMTQQTLSKDIYTLGLDREIIFTDDQDRAEKLRKLCGVNTERFQSLLGFIHSCDLFGIESLVPLGFISPQTFRKRKMEIIRAGINLSEQSERRVLPPLPRRLGDGQRGEIPLNKTKVFSPENK